MWMRTEGMILVIKDLLKSIPGSQGQASTALLQLSQVKWIWRIISIGVQMAYCMLIIRDLVKVLRSYSCQTAPCLHLVLTSIAGSRLIPWSSTVKWQGTRQTQNCNDRFNPLQLLICSNLISGYFGLLVRHGILVTSEMVSTVYRRHSGLLAGEARNTQDMIY